MLHSYFAKRPPVLGHSNNIGVFLEKVAPLKNAGLEIMIIIIVVYF